VSAACIAGIQIGRISGAFIGRFSGETGGQRAQVQVLLGTGSSASGFSASGADVAALKPAQ
jgi:hypothetical protein